MTLSRRDRIILEWMLVAGILLFGILAIGGCAKKEPAVAERSAASAAAAVAAPAGHWSYGAGCLPCATQKPNEVHVCPDGGGASYYLRYDASMMQAPPWSGADEAVAAGQGGAAHTTQYDVQTESGSGIGFKIPLRSGQAYPGSGYIWPAPPRDLPVRNRPGLMLCKVYNDLNGPGAKPCPSGVTAAVYSSQLTAGPEWSGAWPIVNQNFRIPQCQNQPTPSKTPVPPTLPPGVTPTIPPGLPPPCNCQPRPCVMS